MLALLDSGATDNFISPAAVKHFQIPIRTLPKPRRIRNVDGTRNSIGDVTQIIQLAIRHKDKSSIHNFYVVELGEDDMLLGMPFFAATNPKINWTTGTFHGEVLAFTMDSHRGGYRRNIDEPYTRQSKGASLRIDRVTKSTELAVQHVDKTERPSSANYGVASEIL